MPATVVDAVVVWSVRVPPSATPGDLEPLDAPERRRVSAAGTAGVAARRAAGYLLARRAVGEVLGERPADVVIDRTCPRCGEPHGRPRVVTDPGLFLSVTHAGAAGEGYAAAPVVAVAVTRLAPVGIDLVVADEADFSGFEAVARHPDDAATGDAVARARMWARKESALKAVGTGLDVDPASFPAPLPGTVVRLGPDRTPVALADLAPGRAGRGCGAGRHMLVGAVALARDDAAVPVLTG